MNFPKIKINVSDVKDIVKNTKVAVSQAGLVLKKYAPTIMVVGGTVGVVVAGVMACKATHDGLDDILEEGNDHLDDIEMDKQAADAPDMPEYGPYSNRQYTIDRGKIFAQTGLKLFKLYAPSAILGAASVGLIIGSHGIMVRRYKGMAAAYTVVQTAYDKYRERVVEKYGKDVDAELKNGIKKMKVEVEDEDGKKHTEEQEFVNASDVSEYAKIFDEISPNFSKDPTANLIFLRAQQNYANDVLRCRGYLFLNDVYDLLGLPRTTAGQIVGWIYDTKNGGKDCFVDFGIYDKLNVYEARREFVNGTNPYVLLDFNVDGPIYEKLDSCFRNGNAKK